METLDTANLPDDPDELKRIIIALLESNAHKQMTIDELIAEVSRLNLRVKQLLEMIFGKKSEKGITTPSQEETPGETQEESKSEASSSRSEETQISETQTSEPLENPAPEKTKRKKTKNGGGGRMTIPDDIPVRVIEIHPSEEERCCDACQKMYKNIGKSISQRLVYIPARFEVEETHIYAYAGDCGCSYGNVAKEEPDIKPIDKGLISTSLLAIMVVMKYGDHLPLARQATRTLARSGLHFSQSSMCRWMKRASELLEPLYDLIMVLILECKRMQFDATFVDYRDEEVQGRCKRGYVYGARGDDTRPFDLFFFRRDGTWMSIEEFLIKYHEILQVDANPIYDKVFKPEKPDPFGLAPPTEQGCWSHARRKFTDALLSNMDAVVVLNWIGEMYGVERDTKEKTPEQRLLKRQEISVPIMDKIFDWCRENQDKYLPKEPISTAIKYFLNNEAALRIYCTDGTLDIDTEFQKKFKTREDFFRIGK